MIKLKKIRYNNKKKEPNMINLTINTLLIFLQELYIFQGSRERKKRGGKKKISSEFHHVCSGHTN